jgi:hypothetical protein
MDGAWLSTFGTAVVVICADATEPGDDVKHCFS